MTTRTCIALIVVLMFAAAARTASASVITFDENGKGSIQAPSGQQFPLIPAGNIPDPFDPGNGLLPLVYDLTASGIVSPVVPGDMDVLEIPGTPNSDLLRWTTDPATGRSFLVVYSDRAEPGEIPDAADVGLPLARQPNLIAAQESGPEGGVNGVFGYAPAQGMPGFFINSAGDTPVYNFISDTPEPATAGIMSIAGVTLLRRHRRRVR
jgi:hypothetical protein